MGNVLAERKTLDDLRWAIRKVHNGEAEYTGTACAIADALLSQPDVPEPDPDRGEYVTRRELADVLQRELGWHLLRYHEPK